MSRLALVAAAFSAVAATSRAALLEIGPRPGS
jgi:hypothetical protein